MCRSKKQNKVMRLFLLQIPLFFLFQVQVFCEDEEFPQIEDPNIAFIQEYMKKPDVITRPSGLRYRILENGPENGKSPEKNSACECKYIGKNVWGQIFDTSGKKESNTAIFYPGEVIKGFGEALMLMKEGDKWEIVIPADIGYGKHTKGPSLPADATLIFELTLVRVGEAKSTYFKREYLLWILAIGYFIYNYYVSQQKVNEMKKKTPIPVETVQGLPQNKRVFLSIAIDDLLVGDIEFELFSTVCPKTVENFRCLCTGEKGMISPTNDIPLHFKGNIFHRIIPNFMCQGGDITHQNGTGGERIYGPSFDDEFDNGYIPHSTPYLLSMANAGVNTNSSQFFITLSTTEWLDEKHVVFGRAIKGFEVIQQMAATGTSSGKPRVKVVIVNCGEIEVKTIPKNKNI